VRNGLKGRVLSGGLMLAILPIVISCVPWVHRACDAWLDLRPWAHMMVESLNLLWLFVALVALVQWLSSSIGSHRRSLHLSGLVSLTFALALLFPIVSADDDLWQLEIINDVTKSQSIASALKSVQKTHAARGVADSRPPLASQFVFSVFLVTEAVAERAFTVSVATPGETTGNHSPPLG
jgi:hypothetical protein